MAEATNHEKTDAASNYAAPAQDQKQSVQVVIPDEQLQKIVRRVLDELDAEDDSDDDRTDDLMAQNVSRQILQHPASRTTTQSGPSGKPYHARSARG